MSLNSFRFLTKALQSALAPQFDDISKFRGEPYFTEHKIKSVQVLPPSLKVQVSGSATYKVELNWQNLESKNEISCQCTCPHFADGFLCKHIWATILYCDFNGLSIHLPLDSSTHLVRADEQTAIKTPQIEQMPNQNWRALFKEQAQEKKVKGNSSKIGTLQLFFVLDEDPEDEESVTIDFYFARLHPQTGALLGTHQWDLQTYRKITGYNQLRDPQLKAVIEDLAQLERFSGGFYRRHAIYSEASTFELSSLRFLLPALLKTQKVYQSTEDFIDSIVSHHDSSLRFSQFTQMRLKVEENENGFLLSGLIELEGQSIPLGDLHLWAKPDLWGYEQHLGFLTLTSNQQSWFDELYKGPLNVPAEDTEPFLEALLNQSLPFEKPASLAWEEVSLLPEPSLELTQEKNTPSHNSPDRRHYSVDLKLKYGTRTLSYLDRTLKLASQEDQKVYIRDLDKETRLLQLLPAELFIKNTSYLEERPLLPTKNLFAFIQKAFAAGLPVTIENKKVYDSQEFKMNVTSGVDWFDVEGQANFSGRWIKMPDLLKAIQKGETFVPLDNGEMGLISEQLAERLHKISDFGQTTQDGFRFSKAQALILNSLLENENVQVDAAFRKLREKIKDFSGIQKSEPLASFKGKLRKYQKEGLGWLKFLETFELGGILADDMGLGKTIQCLAFLDGRRTRQQAKPSLLLAPKSLLLNWESEAHKFTPELRVCIHAGTERATSHIAFKNVDLIVTTYQTMLRDFQWLREINWDCIVLDEAQVIKNPGALASKAVKLLPAQFRLAMTGTPIENSIQDLFSISDFVNPGFLRGKKGNAHLKLDNDLKQTLGRAFKPIVLRRTKAQVLKDLPAKTEQLISVELEDKQLKLYNELKRFYQGQLLNEIKEQGVSQSQIKILAALTRLRQAALHPALIDSKSPAQSSKFQVVLQMLEEILSENHRVLIFSQFTGLLSLLKVELEKRKIEYCYLDGQTKKRGQVVADFKTKDYPVFLISLKAGGVGLNLVEADYVFLLDPWWNPAVEAQAIDRVHRLGQKRAVNAYRFIAKNTVEEKILKLQKTKKGISEELFDGTSNLLRSLSAQDIENLLS
jgi:SNF2 family DNA or RNA helicase